MIQELAQLSLLDERDGRFGFRDLASARQIAKLLNDGVRLSEIIRAVSEIRKWLPDVGLAAVRLHAGALSDVQVEQPGGRTDKYGQFVLAVDGARDDPDELFDRAHSAEQIGDIAEAERLYRLLMKSDPTDASAPFNLGNMLRAAARTVEAEAALRAATRANPAFAEAWYNLADLLDDQGRSEAAIECLRKAVVVAPGLHRCNVQSGAITATKRRVWRSRGLLAAVFSERSCIGMGGSRTAVAEVLRDPNELAYLPPRTSGGFRPSSLISASDYDLDPASSKPGYEVSR